MALKAVYKFFKRILNAVILLMTLRGRESNKCIIYERFRVNSGLKF